MPSASILALQHRRVLCEVLIMDSKVQKNVVFRLTMSLLCKKGSEARRVHSLPANHYRMSARRKKHCPSSHKMSSSSTDDSSDVESWVEWFLIQEGHEFLCEVDRSFIGEL